MRIARNATGFANRGTSISFPRTDCHAVFCERESPCVCVCVWSSASAKGDTTFIGEEGIRSAGDSLETVSMDEMAPIIRIRLRGFRHAGKQRATIDAG